MNELVEGMDAPVFTLEGDSGSSISLAAHRGRVVALYFYPKDNTSGCTKEAVAFNEIADELAAANTVVIGVSPDSPASHDKFKAKFALGFQLASDTEKEVVTAYGVWVEKFMYGRKYMGVERSTFLIDGSGKIAKVWRKVKVPGHAAAVLTAAQAL